MTVPSDLLDATFTGEVRQKADTILSRYETKRAAILEILRLVMETYGHIDRQREVAVAEYLNLPPIDVHEVLTFYTLFYRKPKAQMRLNVCRTLSCSLLGGKQILEYLEEKLGIHPGGMTADNRFFLQTVECLGACELAPMLQLNDEQYIGFLTTDKIDRILSGRPSE